MCGILAILSLDLQLSGLRALIRKGGRDVAPSRTLPSEPGFVSKEVELLLPALARRGPDEQSWREVEVNDGRGLVAMYAAVLHLRGDQRCDQPVADQVQCRRSFTSKVFQHPVIEEGDHSGIDGNMAGRQPADMARGDHWGVVGRSPRRQRYFSPLRRALPRLRRRRWLRRSAIARRPLCLRVPIVPRPWCRP